MDEAVLDVILSLREEGSQAAAQMDRELQGITDSASRAQRELDSVSRAADQLSEEMRHINDPDKLAWATEELRLLKEQAAEAAEKVRTLARAEDDAARWDGIRLVSELIAVGTAAEHASDELGRITSPDQVSYLGSTIQLEAFAEAAGVATEHVRDLADAERDAAAALDAVNREYADSAARMSAFNIQQGITAQAASFTTHRYRETSDVLERMDRELEAAGSSSTRLGDRLIAQVPAMALTNRWAEMNTDQFKKLADAIDDASRRGGFFSNMMGAIGGAVGGAIGGAAASLVTPDGNKGGDKGGGGGGGGGAGGFLQGANVVLPGGQGAAALILSIAALMTIMSPFTAVFVAATVQVAAFAVGVTLLAATLAIGAGAALGLAGAIGFLGLSAQGGADAASNLIKAHSTVAAATKLHQTALDELKVAQAQFNASKTPAHLEALGLAQAYAAATATHLTEAQAVQTESARGINGPVAKLIETYDKLTEAWGLRAIPYTNQMANALAALAPIIGNVGNAVFDWFAVRWPAIFSLADHMIRALITAFVELGPPIGRVIDYVLAHSTQFEAFFSSILDWGVHAFTGLLDNLIAFSDWFFQRLPALAANTSTVMDAIGKSFQWLADKLGNVTDFFIEHWDQIVQAAGDAAAKLGEGWRAALPPDVLRGALQGIADGLKKITDDGNKMNNFFFALGQILGTALPLILALAGIISNLVIGAVALVSYFGLLSPLIDLIVLGFLAWRAVLVGGWIVALFGPIVGLAANFWILATAEDAAGASAAFAYYQINGAGGLIGLIGRIGLLAGAAWTATAGLFAQAGASIAAALGMEFLTGAVTAFLAATVIGLLLVALAFLVTHLTEAGAVLQWLGGQFANAAKIAVDFGTVLVDVATGNVVGAAVAAHDAWEAFTTGFANNGALIVAVTKSTAAQGSASMNQMLKDSQIAAGKFESSWQTSITGVGKDFQALEPSAKAAADAAARQIHGSWVRLEQETSNDFAQIGDQMDSGIVFGLLRGQQHVNSTAVDVVLGAAAAATHAIQARSPSKLFAEVVGYPISLGIAQGIMDGAHQIADALNTVLTGGTRNIGSAINAGISGAGRGLTTAINAQGAFGSGVMTAGAGPPGGMNVTNTTIIQPYVFSPIPPNREQITVINEQLRRYNMEQK